MAGAFVKVGNVSGTNVLTFTPTNNGDWLICVISTSSGGGSPTVALADNHSSNWQTLIATNEYDAILGSWYSVFYLENCSTSITTITATINGGNPGTLFVGVAEYSGLATSSSVLAHTSLNVQKSPGTGSNAVTSGNVNFSSVPGLLISLGNNYSGGSNITHGTGFTSDGVYASGSQSGIWENQRLTLTNAAVANFYNAVSGTEDMVTFAVAVLEPSSGTAYNLNAAMGSFGLTGEAALRGLAITAAEGSFALTGKTVTFQRAANIASNQGAFALTGNSASLVWSGSGSGGGGVSSGGVSRGTVSAKSGTGVSGGGVSGRERT